MSTKAAATAGSGTTDTVIAIKWSQILVEENNIRTGDLPKIKEIAESLKARGQLTPIVVQNGGPKDKPYKLVAGNRRMAAYAENGWQSREIYAVVRHYAEGDVVGPLVDQWVENVEREDVSFLDRCERVYQFANGTYPVPEGTAPTALDKETIAARLNIKSVRTVEVMIKVFRDLDPDVAHRARKEGAPSSLLIALSRIVGEGETKDEKEEDRAQKQSALLDEWIAHRDELEGAGRKRSERSDKGKSKKGKKAKKKAAAAAEETEWGAVDPDVILDQKERTPKEYFTVIAKLANAGTLSKEERQTVQGALLMFRFLTGELKRLPFLTEAVWSDLLPAPADEDGDEGED